MTTDILQPKNGLVVYKNAHTTIRLTVTNADGKPTNLTGGRLIFTVKSSTRDSTVIITKTSDSASQIAFESATGGLAAVYLTPDDTKNLAIREYVFDVWLVQAGKQLPVVSPTILDLRPGVTVTTNPYTGVVLPPSAGAAAVVPVNSPTINGQVPESVLIDGKWFAQWTTPGIVSRARGGFGEDISAKTGIPLLLLGSVSYVVPPAGNLVGTTETQTLSGKTIDGTSNTFINVPTSALSGSYLASLSQGDGLRVSNSGSDYTVHGDAKTCTPEIFLSPALSYTDETVDFTAALEAAEAAMLAGTYRTLKVGARTYKRTSGSFTLPAGCSIVGYGPGISIISTTADAPNVLIGGENVAIKGVTLKGNSTGSSQHMIKDGTTGVSGSGHSRVDIEDVELLNAGANGFDYQENPFLGGLYLGPTLTNVRALGCSNGFNFGNRGEYASLVNCRSEGAVNWGFIDGAGNVQFNGCSSTGDHSGVWITNGGNGGHSQWSGGAINHPGTGNSILIDTALGYKFIGASIYAALNGVNVTTNARGVLLSACQLSVGSLDVAANATVRFESCIFATAATRNFDATAQVEFENCKDLNGSIPSWLGSYLLQPFAFTSNADATLSVSQSCAREIPINTGSLTSNGKTVRLGLAPNAGRECRVRNNTPYSINVGWATGATQTLASGLACVLGADGTDATKVIGETPSSVGASGHANLSDGAGGWTDWNGVTGGPGFLSLGTNPATGGVLNFSNGNTVKGRRTDNADVQLLAFTSSNVLQIGELNSGLSGLKFQTHSAIPMTFAVGAGTTVTFALAQNTFTNPIAIGTSPATAGDLRLAYGAAINSKTSGGTDCRLIEMSTVGSGTAWIGEESKTNQVWMSAISEIAALSGSFKYKNTSGAATYVTFTPTLNTFSNPIDFSAGATTAGTILRIPDATARAVVAGTKTILATSSTEGFLFTDSSYGNQCSIGRIYPSTSLVLGIGGGSNYVVIGSSLVRNFVPATIEIVSQAASSADGLTILAFNAASAGTPVRLSPRLRLLGNAWNSSTLASENHEFIQEVVPASNAGATTSYLRFARALNGGAYSDLLRLNSDASLILGSGGLCALADGGSSVLQIGMDAAGLNKWAGLQLFATANINIGIGSSTLLRLQSSIITASQPVTITKGAIATTSTDGLSFDNTTAATAGVPVQYSARGRKRGTAWNSSGSASETHDWIDEVRPSTVAGTTTSGLVFARSVAGGAYSDVLRLVSDGSVRIGTNPGLSGSLGLPNAGGMYFRNVGNTADIFGLGVDTASNLLVGVNGANNGEVRLQSGAAQAVKAILGGTTYWSVTNALMTSANPVTITKGAIATTSTDGLSFDNTTAATAGVPVQYSTRLRLRGHAYNSTSGLDETHDYAQEVQPVTVAGSTTSSLVFKRSLNGGAYSDILRLNSSGSISIGTNPAVSDGLGLGNNSGISWRRTNNVDVKLLNFDASNVFQIGVLDSNLSGLKLQTHSAVPIQFAVGAGVLVTFAASLNTFSNPIQFPTQSTPATPGAGSSTLFFDGTNWKYINSAGVVKTITAT